MPFVVDQLLGTNLATTASSVTGRSPYLKKGDEVSCSDGSKQMYVRASAAVAQYAFVKIDDDLSIAELTTTLSGAEPTRVGCAQVAFAAGDHGYVVTQGNFTGLTAKTSSADVLTYTHATAGKVSTSSSSSADVIIGLKLTAAASGATNGTFFAATTMATNT